MNKHDLSGYQTLHDFIKYLKFATTTLLVLIKVSSMSMDKILSQDSSLDKETTCLYLFIANT